MKINAVRAMLIISLVIILLYILGLFLPIIKNTKNAKNNNLIIFDVSFSNLHMTSHRHASVHLDRKFQYLFSLPPRDTI